MLAHRESRQEDDSVEPRLAELKAELLTDFGQRFSELRSEMDRRFALVDARFEALEAKLLGRLESRIEGVRTEMLRWMLAVWSSMMLVLLGTLFAVLRAR